MRKFPILYLHCQLRFRQLQRRDTIPQRSAIFLQLLAQVLRLLSSLRLGTTAFRQLLLPQLCLLQLQPHLFCRSVHGSEGFLQLLTTGLEFGSPRRELANLLLSRLEPLPQTRALQSQRHCRFIALAACGAELEEPGLQLPDLALDLLQALPPLLQLLSGGVSLQLHLLSSLRLSTTAFRQLLLPQLCLLQPLPHLFCSSFLSSEGFLQLLTTGLKFGSPRRELANLLLARL
mmetsp:Transcript_47717/g.153553  ORF Transcript_47717/g.153553 Transcript_47717/m.153553 type:complete len:232 (+) Transcript_47717:1181-1876(+)